MGIYTINVRKVIPWVDYSPFNVRKVVPLGREGDLLRKEPLFSLPGLSTLRRKEAPRPAQGPGCERVLIMRRRPLASLCVTDININVVMPPSMGPGPRQEHLPTPVSLLA